MGDRQISDSFLEKLKNEYRGMIEYLKKDKYLALLLRGEQVIVYYKGFKLFGLSKDGTFEPGNADKLTAPVLQKTKEDWQEYFYEAKGFVDTYKIREKDQPEKEIQQQILWENNFFTKRTDYIILDMEYVIGQDENKETGRADIVAAFWPGRTRSNMQLALIEVKIGEAAVSGDAGVDIHYKDIVNFFKTDIKKTCKDMSTIAQQLRHLGLIPVLDKVKTDIEITADKPQFIFALANYNQKSKRLKNALKNIKHESSNSSFELLFAESSFMGYGLYRNSMKTFEKFTEYLDPKKSH